MEAKRHHPSRARSTNAAIWSCLAAALLLCCGVAKAQAVPARQHQSWSTDAGLPQSSVHQILQAHDGYLWLATEGGAVRYDGVTFVVFNHDADSAFRSNDTTSLAEDRSGDLWIGTADGLIRLHEGKLRRFAEADGLPSASVLALAACDDGSVVVLTDMGAGRMRNGRFEVLTGLPATIDSMRQQPDGSVLFAGDGKVLQLRRGSLTTLAVASGFPLRGVVTSPQGLWTWGDREVEVSESGQPGEWRTGQELPGSRVQTVFIDHTGAVWVGTNRGLVVLRAAEKPLLVSALGSNSVLSIYEDAEHDMWIGTETSGLHALRPRSFRSVPALSDEEVSCVTQTSDGALWVGTRDDGLRRIRGIDDVERPVRSESLTSPVILALAAGAEGSVWAGTPDGLNHVSATGQVQHVTSSDGLPDDLVRSLLVAHDGTVWAGTRRGLARLRDGHIDTLTQSDGLGADLVGVMKETQGAVWVATLAGVSRVEGRKIHNFGRAEGLTSTLVSGIAEDAEGRLWVTTRDAGVFLLQSDRFVAVGSALFPVEVLGVLADHTGFLWLRTRHGVMRVSARDLAACTARAACTATPQLYGVEDGMPSVEVTGNGEPSGWQAADGALWFPTRKGVAVVDPAALPLNAVPPPVVIERFLADNDVVPVTGDTATLASGHDRYTFDFAGLSFVSPSKVMYSVRLEGFDREWSAPSARRSASYTNLPPGVYTFRVRAANNDGVWNDAGASLRFRVLPPLYRRWWFLLLLLLLLGAIVLGLYRLRTSALERRYQAVLEERNRIAREIHDTLAQDMVGISLQLDMVTQLLRRDKVPEAMGQVCAMRSFVQNGIEEARQSIWNLRANTAGDSLPARVKAVAAKVSAAGLAMRTKLGGEYRPLRAELEAEVLRVLQEALSNVERHAQATRVSVQLTYGRDTLVLTVEDDGRGFNLEEATARAGHFGLRGMRERAAAIGADLRWVSREGKGTTMEMQVPIAGKRGSPR